ncbi:hypothetical protein MXB_1150 [Myxobolus squamalis]|nr:hypothetical protein MXB_1150 [Myxobolus squamalis]
MRVGRFISACYKSRSGTSSSFSSSKSKSNLSRRGINSSLLKRISEELSDEKVEGLVWGCTDAINTDLE